MNDWFVRHPLIGEGDWSDHVLKNSIDHALRPAISYFQTKCYNLISLMEKKLFLNSINKGSSIYSNNCSVNNTRSFPQQLLHTIINNQNFPCRKEPSQLWVIAKITYQFQIKHMFVLFKIILMISSNKSYWPFGPDINYSLQSVYRNGLIPKLDFG